VVSLKAQASVLERDVVVEVSLLAGIPAAGALRTTAAARAGPVGALAASGAGRRRVAAAVSVIGAGTRAAATADQRQLAAELPQDISVVYFS
jgi:hypothetical protein